MTDHEMRTDNNRARLNVTLRLVAQKIPPEALGWLWTVHRMGEWDCSAHTHGETCCVDVLLEAAPPPVASHELGALAEIIVAGYDLIIESAGDDRNGELNIFLTHPEQANIDELMN